MARPNPPRAVVVEFTGTVSAPAITVGVTALPTIPYPNFVRIWISRYRDFRTVSHSTLLTLTGNKVTWKPTNIPWGTTLYAMGAVQNQDGVSSGVIKEFKYPNLPGPVEITEFDYTAPSTVLINCSFAFHNGGQVTAHQVQYSISPTYSPEAGAPAGSTRQRLTIAPGHTWHFRMRGRNTVGWGPWSDTYSFRNVPGAMIKHAGLWRNTITYVKVAGVWRETVPYVNNMGVWRLGVGRP